jgi:hypothetical protein
MVRRVCAGSGAVFRILALSLALLAPGCGARSPQERAGLEFLPPAGWHPIRASEVLVPGKVLGAWSGPEGAVLVLYQTLPSPGADVDKLRVELVNRLASLPEARVVHEGRLNLGEVPALRVDIVAPGTGQALAPSGLGSPAAPEGVKLVPTRRVTLAIPRGSDTVWLTCHFPDSARDRFRVLGEEILKMLRVEARPVASTSY